MENTTYTTAAINSLWAKRTAEAINEYTNLTATVLNDSEFTVKFDNIEEAEAAVETAKVKFIEHYLYMQGGNPRNKRAISQSYAAVKRAMRKAVN